MSRKCSLFLVCLHLLASFLTEATENQSTPEHVTLQLKWHHQFQFAGYYAAKHKGFYQAEGLDVTFAEYEPGLSVVDNIVSGQVQYGIGDVGVLLSYVKGEPIKALAAIFQHNPLIYISKKSSGILSPYEMHGKRIMQEMGTADNLPLLAMLTDAQLSPHHYTSIVHSYNLDAFLADEVDVLSAYLSNEPYALNNLGVDINIIRPQSYGVDFYGDLLMTSNEELVKYPGRAERFLRATLKGWHYALDHSNEIIDLIINDYAPYALHEKLEFEATQIKNLIVRDKIPLGQIKIERLRNVADVYQRLNLVDNVSDEAIDRFLYNNFNQIALNQDERVWLRNNQVIRLGIDKNHAPYEWLDPQTLLHQGISADYFNLLSKKLGVTFNVHPHDSWHELLSAVKNKEVDVLSSLVKTPDREKFLTFTRPYLNSMAVIIANQSEGYLGDLKSLEGKTVAIEKGHFTEELLRKNHPNIKIEATETIEDALDAISHGQAYAYVGDVTAASYVMKNAGYLNLTFAGATPYSSQLRMAVSKDQPELASILNKALKSISQQEHDDIYHHWQAIKTPQGFSLKTIVNYAVITLSVFLFIMFWVFRLARSELALKNSERNLKLILETLPDCVCKLDHTGQIIDINRTGLNMINAETNAAIIGRNMTEFINENDVSSFTNMLGTVKSMGKAKQEVQLIQKGADDAWVEFYAVMLQTQDAHQILTVARDITQRKKNEEAQKVATVVYENTSEAMMVLDKNNFIIAINPAFTHLTGYSFSDVRGKSPNLLKSGIQDTYFYQQLWSSVIETGHWEGELWNKKKDGSLYAERMHINTVFGKNNEPELRVALFSDITESKQAEEEIWHQANFDPLTTLPNRNMFLDRLAQDLKLSARSELPLALIYLDLDFFKDVNDTLGHDKGDQLLCEVAVRLSDCVRETDTVARLGGDEFVIILPSITERNAVERIAINIIDSLSQTFHLGPDKAYISASLGIALYPTQATDGESLINYADKAMYQAKQKGRGQLCFFDHLPDKPTSANSVLLNDLKSAIDNQQLELYFLPVVNIQTQQIIMLEALLRWNHPVHGLLPPASFLTIAEENGLMSNIGHWALQKAVSQATLWRNQLAPHISIAVNRSVLEFRSHHGHDPWLEYLKAQDKSDLITLELNEQLLANLSPADVKTLTHFHHAGTCIALDNFGSNFHSPSALLDLPIDYLKIDQRYIHHLQNPTQESFLAETVILMANKMGIKVIAEGVESKQQQNSLTKIGCDYAQGFLYYKPLTANECEDVLRSNPAAAKNHPLEGNG